MQNVKKMEMIGEDKAGLFMLDKDLGGRVAGQQFKMNFYSLKDPVH